MFWKFGGGFPIQKLLLTRGSFFICVKILKNSLLFKKHVYICLTNLKNYNYENIRR